MNIKGITIEDFVNYKKPSIFISMGTCDFKCARDGGFDKSVCQNSTLAHTPDLYIEDSKILNWYLDNPITQAIVIGGMEPFTYWHELIEFIRYARKHTDDDIVIYTGFYPYEIAEQLKVLDGYDNIIIKFGRFIPGQTPKFDEVLGVELASPNQYACRLNKGCQETIQAVIDSEGHCPCMIAMTEDTKCACAEFRNQESGECHCGIFSK